MNSVHTLDYFDSLANHQLRPKSGFALPVTLLESDNKYLKYPCDGVIVAFEHGMNLTLVQAVFHAYDWRRDVLGAPVVVKHPKFKYGDWA